MYGKCNHSADSSPSCKRLGFLQKNNSLEERSRIVSSFKERAAKNRLSCDNLGGDARFRRTETDFSNLFARGRLDWSNNKSKLDGSLSQDFNQNKLVCLI